MGYTHGTRWTDDVIKERILEIVKFNRLDRMPTRQKLKRISATAL